MYSIHKTYRAEADLIDVWRYTKAIDDVHIGYRALAVGRHIHEASEN